MNSTTSKMAGAILIAACTTGLASAADQPLCTGDCLVNRPPPPPAPPVPHLANGLPDFSSGNMGFASDGVEFFPVPGEKFVPVTNDPAHPFCGNRRMAKCGNQILPPIADIKNPILQPWAAGQMKRTNDEILSGKESFEAMSRCWPGGVPGMMLFTAQPGYWVQSPKEVTILYSRGPYQRHVYLNVPHSPNVTPSWFGESVGHYEGDELVIDTIGLSDKTFVDWYHTPHTDKMHVIERYKLIEGGKRMQGTVTVEDPGTFTTKWSGLHYFNRQILAIADSEYVCAENNNANYFDEPGQVPIPESRTPDF
jgi:hypothetical protein